MQKTEQVQNSENLGRHDWKAPKREKAKFIQPHPLHGHLKKIVIARIPAAGGYYLKRMKLKTALQKGYYKVNTTDIKTKAAIEKALEPFNNSDEVKA